MIETYEVLSSYEEPDLLEVLGDKLRGKTTEFLPTYPNAPSYSDKDQMEHFQSALCQTKALMAQVMHFAKGDVNINWTRMLSELPSTTVGDTLDIAKMRLYFLAKKLAYNSHPREVVEKYNSTIQQFRDRYSFLILAKQFNNG